MASGFWHSQDEISVLDIMLFGRLRTSPIQATASPWKISRILDAYDMSKFMKDDEAGDWIKTRGTA